MHTKRVELLGRKDWQLGRKASGSPERLLSSGPRKGKKRGKEGGRDVAAESPPHHKIRERRKATGIGKLKESRRSK